MAESVVKLRVDSQEYDAKIRRAADGVRAFGENCRKAGEGVTKADKDTLEYVRAIGQMETVTKTAKGKINEMTTAFTELSVQYKNLTDEEKKSPFGQALSQSLDQLKTRIKDSKTQLQEVTTELGNTSSKGEETGGIMQQLAGKFSVTIDAVKLFNIGMQAASSVLGVAKDAFFQNEQQLDEWGRVVASSESVYRGFLNAINNGDISGFLGKISDIVKAARDAYDALDELATFNAFNQINVERTRFELSDAINNYREGSGSKEQVKAAGDAAAKEVRVRQQKQQQAYEAAVGKLAAERGVDKKDLLDALSGSYGHYSDLKKVMPTGKRTAFYGGGMFGGGGSYTESYAQTRQEQLGVALRKINDTELQALQSLGADAFRSGIEAEGIERQVNRTLRGRTGGGGGGGGRTTVGRGGHGGGGGNTPPPPPPEGSIAAQEALVQQLTKAWREASDQAGRDGYLAQLNEAKAVLDEMQGKVKEVIPEGSLKALKEDLSALNAERELLSDPIEIAIKDTEIARVQEEIDRLNGKSSASPVRSGGGMGFIESINDEIRSANQQLDTSTFRNLMKYMMVEGIEGVDIPTEYLQEAIFGEEMNIPDEYWANLETQINERLAELGIEPIKIDVSTGEVTKVAKEVKEGWRDAAHAVQAVGSALQQIENPTAKIAGIVGEAIANIALGFAQATAKDSKMGVFGWIAAIAGGLGTMISTIAAIKSATAGAYAEGGIVPGNHFSGDMNIARVNSGELILNRAQQNTLAGQLSGGIQDLNLTAAIDVEELVFSINNMGRRTGSGELIKSN